MERHKISIRIFMWIVGGIVLGGVLISGFLWNGIKAEAMSNHVFHKEVGDKMTEMSVDLRVIKREIEAK